MIPLLENVQCIIKRNVSYYTHHTLLFEYIHLKQIESETVISTSPNKLPDSGVTQDRLKTSTIYGRMSPDEMKKIRIIHVI